MISYYEIIKGNNAKQPYYFLLKSANHEIVGGSLPEYYPTKHACKEGIVAQNIASECAKAGIDKSTAHAMQTPDARRARLKSLVIKDCTGE